MKIDKLVFLIVLVVALLFAVLPSTPETPTDHQNQTETTQYEKFCSTSRDCVPEQCCHPTSCVNRNYAPDCSDIVCTMECRPGTMDCGQGHCECVNNRCKAVISG